MPQDEQQLANAVAAGWNPDDGEPPHEHGAFVEGLAAATNIADLRDPDADR